MFMGLFGGTLIGVGISQATLWGLRDQVAIQKKQLGVIFAQQRWNEGIIDDLTDDMMAVQEKIPGMMQRHYRKTGERPVDLVP